MVILYFDTILPPPPAERTAVVRAVFTPWAPCYHLARASAVTACARYNTTRDSSWGRVAAVPMAIGMSAAVATTGLGLVP